MHMYLVQTGKFISTDQNKSMTLMYGRDNRIVDFNYMGAAEFEWGAVPASYKRMLDMAGNDDLTFYMTSADDLTTIGECPVIIICKKDMIGDVLDELKKYINYNNPVEVSTYRLKEHCDFHEHFYEFYRKEHIDRIKRYKASYKRYNMNYDPNGRDAIMDNFYMDIKNDFIFAVGTTDRLNTLKQALANDFIRYKLGN